MSATVDRPPLAALVAYEQLVAFGYRTTLSRAQLSASQRATIERFSAEVEESAAALRHALRGVGGTPSPPPNPALAPRTAGQTPREFFRQLVTAEESSLQAYFTAFQTLSDPHHIAGCAAFMAQAGRRLVVLRQLAGEPPLPRAFETGGA